MSHRSSVPLALILYNVLALASPAAAQNLYPRPEFTFPAPYTSANDPKSRRFIENRDGDFVGWVSAPGTVYGCDALALINRSTLAMTLLHVLDQQSEGCLPQSVTEGRDGNLYSVTRSGGPYGWGTVFRVSPDGASNVLHAFTGGTGGGGSEAPLMLAANGNLYGTTTGRPNTCCSPGASSTIFTVSESGSFTTIANISNVIVNLPNTPVATEGPLFQASDCRIYGTTFVGPGTTRGAIYRIELDGSLTVVQAFASWSESDENGIYPNTGVIEAADGNFYGTTSSGGAYSRGTVFRMTPAGDLTTVLSLRERVGLPLVEGGNGFLFGTSDFSTFSVSPGGRILPLWGFSSVPLLKSRDGRIWGVYRTGLFSFSDGPSVLSSIDSPRPGESVTEPFVVTGWAFDRSRPVNDIDTVHLWAFPDDGSAPTFVGASGYGAARPDVAQRFGATFTNTGFGLTVRNLAPGTYRLVAYAYSGEWDGFDRRAPASVTVTVRDVVASSPRIHMDTLVHRGSVPESFSIRGWAIDLAAADTTGVDAVHVYAYPNWNVSTSPTFLGTAVYGGSRADIGASFGPTLTNSAFDLRAILPNGPYTVVAFAHSTVTGLYSADAREITVRPPGDPQMALDAPVNGATVSQPFLVGGWSIDRDASNGSGVSAVHVWAYPKTGAAPIFLGPATYGAFRYDVSVSIDPVATQRCVFEDPANARTICPFGFSSFGLLVDALSAGTYDVVAFAHSTVTGRFSAQRQATVTVH